MNHKTAHFIVLNEYFVLMIEINLLINIKIYSHQRYWIFWGKYKAINKKVKSKSQITESRIILTQTLGQSSDHSVTNLTSKFQQNVLCMKIRIRFSGCLVNENNCLLQKWNPYVWCHIQFNSTCEPWIGSIQTHRIQTNMERKCVGLAWS